MSLDPPSGPPPPRPPSTKYLTWPLATYCLNSSSVGAGSLPLQPPIPITALPLASSSEAADCEPVVAAAHVVVVFASSSPTALLAVSWPPPPPKPPMASDDGPEVGIEPLCASE